ncbi:hypothetical protein O5O51_14325 [Sinirhodobacter sp. HNIBRBA609]|nr:hypothetical protein O5O51_14325 [Sinirhodobacter sp. HNIBRBA609]
MAIDAERAAGFRSAKSSDATGCRILLTECLEVTARPPFNQGNDLEAALRMISMSITETRLTLVLGIRCREC